MFEETSRNSGRYPFGTVGCRSIAYFTDDNALDRLFDEMVRQDHVKEVHEILDLILGSAFNLLDDNTVSTEIKALAADVIRTYGEAWSVSFDEKTQARLKELLGE